MVEKKYRLYCDYCGYSRWTDGIDISDLVIYKRSPVPTSIPKYDTVSKKMITKVARNQPKQFKCPNCGRVITPKKYINLPTKEPKIEENPSTGSQAGSA